MKSCLKRNDLCCHKQLNTGAFILIIGKRLISILLVLCLTLTLTFCSRKEDGEKEPDKVLVVTTFYPVYIFTLNLTWGIKEIEVSNMTQQNAGCLHDYRLLTRDMKLLSDADMLVLCGAGMESFLEEILRQLPALRTVDSSVGVRLLYESGGVSSHMQTANSHIWMSVKNAIIQVDNICAALKSLCPGYTDELEKNRTEYTLRLQNLYEEITAFSKEFTGAPIVSVHNAFGYMAKELSFDAVAQIESESFGEPSARKLGELSKLIKKLGVKALFVHPGYTGSAAEILSEETGIPLLILNPITGGDAQLTSYEDLMRKNVRTIAEIYK